MYKAVFGWLKKGGVPTGNEIKALDPLLLEHLLLETLIRKYGPVSDVAPRKKEKFLLRITLIIRMPD